MWTKRVVMSARLFVALALGLGAVGCGDGDGGDARSGEGIEFRCVNAGDHRIEAVDFGFGVRFDLVPPAQVTDTPDGLTVTLFPSGAMPAGGFDPQIGFTARGRAAEKCGVSSVNAKLPTVSAGTRTGVAIAFSHAELADLVVSVRSSVGADCSAVREPGDLVVAYVIANTPEGTIAIDGIAIGATAATFPSAESVLPACLPPSDPATPTPFATATPTSTPTRAPAGCGNGIPARGFSGGPNQEECDDGNHVDGDGCSATCLIEPTVTDLSDFGIFEFQRGSAFDFCPPVDALFDLRAESTDADTVTLSWSVLRDTTNCTVLDQTCPDRDHFSRTLSASEATSLREAFRAVRVVESLPTGCTDIAIDPCLVNAFRWDDFGAVDFLCHTPLLRRDETERLFAVLNELTS
jgi:cysteine-rich repeat protein